MIGSLLLLAGEEASGRNSKEYVVKGVKVDDFIHYTKISLEAALIYIYIFALFTLSMPDFSAFPRQWAFPSD